MGHPVIIFCLKHIFYSYHIPTHFNEKFSLINVLSLSSLYLSTLPFFISLPFSLIVLRLFFSSHILFPLSPSLSYVFLLSFYVSTLILFCFFISPSFMSTSSLNISFPSFFSSFSLSSSLSYPFLSLRLFASFVSFSSSSSFLSRIFLSPLPFIFPSSFTLSLFLLLNYPPFVSFSLSMFSSSG